MDKVGGSVHRVDDPRGFVSQDARFAVCHRLLADEAAAQTHKTPQSVAVQTEQLVAESERSRRCGTWAILGIVLLRLDSSSSVCSKDVPYHFLI